MKRTFITLLFAALALCVLAETPRLTRSDLRHAIASSDRLTPSQVTAGSDAAVSPQQLMRERHLTLDDNRFNSKVQRSQSIDDVTGDRIVWIDACDFDWDDENGVAIVNDSSHLIMGKYCTIGCGESDSLYLFDFFDTYEIPIDVDFTTGDVTIQAGVPLGVKTEWLFDFEYHVRYELISTLYAVPMSWLMGDDDLSVIHGLFTADGTIMLDEGFALLVYRERDYMDRDNTGGWSLSPIFTTFWLLKPNGTHEFQVSHDDLTGISDPVLPPDGHGGLVPRPVRPGSTKSVVPRPLTPEIDTLSHNGRGGRNMLSAIRDGRTSSPDQSTLQREQVYVYQLDDTTLMVYNLFGSDFCWNYMFKYPDKTLVFPGQQISEDLIYGVCYNASRDSSNQDLVDFGNAGHANFITATWDDTYLCTRTGSAICAYKYNRLVYRLKEPGVNPDTSYYVQPPTFAEPQLTDTTVEFSAASTESYCLSNILMWNDDTGDYQMTSNPLTVPRCDEPYWVNLAAYSVNVSTHSFSGMVYFDYEVPARVLMRGDVNGNGSVTIADVTALINYLLTDDSTGIILAKADVNANGSITIADVTTLINYLLTDQWPD